ncbi:MAG: hypothetical protein OXP12_00425 [Thaumarchaeota archaeon]|nr:hypothetical protein [Nitrososphaerota archaeon]MDE0267052.1 hypothetical protein [Nitrososphaerota archaeon]MDE0526722.1 hypothetical protein [Nitrososphaerota archaeon]
MQSETAVLRRELRKAHAERDLCRDTELLAAVHGGGMAELHQRL